MMLSVDQPGRAPGMGTHTARTLTGTDAKGARAPQTVTSGPFPLGRPHPS